MYLQMSSQEKGKATHQPKERAAKKKDDHETEENNEAEETEKEAAGKIKEGR